MDTLRLEPRFDPAQISARVREIAGKLDAEFSHEAPALVSVLKGSSFLLADLAREMQIRVACEYISVSRHAASDDILQIDFATGFPLGRPVILLKDVVHTGVLESYLITQLAAAGASPIRLVCILDKVAERTTDTSVDFPLFSIEGGRFAGYGMTHEGLYANLPYIAEVYASS